MGMVGDAGGPCPGFLFVGLFVTATMASKQVFVSAR